MWADPLTNESSSTKLPGDDQKLTKLEGDLFIIICMDMFEARPKICSPKYAKPDSLIDVKKIVTQKVIIYGDAEMSYSNLKATVGRQWQRRAS